MVDDAAAAVAGGAGADLLEVDVAFAPAFDLAAAAAAGGAGVRLGAGPGPRAAAGRTGFGAGEPHHLRAAARHPLQRHGQPDLDVGAARRPGAAAEKAVEQPHAAEIGVEPAKQILEIDAAEQVFRGEAGDPGKAVGVIFGPLLRVGQDGVGFRDLLEFRLRPGLLVAIRMIFEGERAEGVLDRLLVGVPGNAQHLVVVTLSSWAYEDALSKCSTDTAPWYIVPGNHKWYRNLAVAHTIVHSMRQYKEEWKAALEERGREELEKFKQLRGQN